MSYANGPHTASRAPESPSAASHHGPRRGSADPGDENTDAIRSPRGRPYETSYDWGRVGLLGVALAAGALIGAGAALLMAPSSGTRTRRRLGRGVARARLRAAGAWDDLGERIEARREGRDRGRRGR